MVGDTAVTDTGPPLHVTEIGQEHQLRLFAQLALSDQVKAELTWYGIFERVAVGLGERLVVDSVSAQELAEQEAALAARRQPEMVLTDDLSLRKGLEAHGFLIVGSVGVLVRTFRAGRLTRQELGDLLDRLFDDSSPYLSKGFRVHLCRLLEALTE